MDVLTIPRYYTLRMMAALFSDRTYVALVIRSFRTTFMFWVGNLRIYSRNTAGFRIRKLSFIQTNTTISTYTKA